MTDAFAKTAAAVMVAAGVAVELNLLRVMVNEIREVRRERRRSSFRSRSPGGAGARTLGLAGVMALAPVSAVAQPPTAVETPTSSAATPVAVPAAPLTVSSDRPSFSDGTGIQPLRHLNFETGYTFTHRDRDGVETDRHNAPEVLLRLGLVDDRAEVRLVTSGYAWSDTDTGSGSTSADDWNDVALGVKVKLLDQEKWFPRIAVEAQTTLGAGGSQAGTQEVEPVFKFLWSTDVGAAAGDTWKGWTIGGNLNVAFPTSSGDRFTQFQGSVYAVFPIVDSVSGFAEYYVLAPNSKGTDAAHYADIGATWLVSPRVQLDARVGFGLNDEADDIFAGVGVSLLF